MNTPDSTRVKLTTACKPGTEYVLTVSNVTSANGSTLDPQKSEVSFTVPGAEDTEPGTEEQE